MHRFTNVNAKWPGSTHDATVFDNSSLKDHLATNKPGWLLGDSGYPLREYLITPKVFSWIVGFCYLLVVLKGHTDGLCSTI